MFNPVLNSARNAPAKHLFYSWWVHSFAAKATSQQKTGLNSGRQLASLFLATPKEEKLTLKPRQEANATQTQPEKLHCVPAQGGKEPPETSLSFKAEKPAGKQKLLFCPSAGDLAEGLSAMDRCADTAPLEVIP